MDFENQEITDPTYISIEQNVGILLNALASQDLDQKEISRLRQSFTPEVADYLSDGLLEPLKGLPQGENASVADVNVKTSSSRIMQIQKTIRNIFDTLKETPHLKPEQYSALLKKYPSAIRILTQIIAALK